MAIYSGISHKKIVIFHSYVKLPEGILIYLISFFLPWPSQPSACRAAAAATRAASAASMALKVLAAWVSVIFQRLAC